MKKILFVCTGNTCRSPMAEALFNARKGTDEWVAESAGVFASSGSPASSNAIAALKELEIDLQSHRSQPVTRTLLEDADLVLTMTNGHRYSLLQNFPEFERKVYLLNAFGTSKVPADVLDPFGGSLEMYQKTRDEIDRSIADLVLFIHTK